MDLEKANKRPNNIHTASREQSGISALQHNEENSTQTTERST